MTDCGHDHHPSTQRPSDGWFSHYLVFIAVRTLMHGVSGVGSNLQVGGHNAGAKRRPKFF